MDYGQISFIIGMVFIVLLIQVLSFWQLFYKAGLISVGVARAFGKGFGFAKFGLMMSSFFGYMYLGWG